MKYRATGLAAQTCGMARVAGAVAAAAESSFFFLAIFSVGDCLLNPWATAYLINILIIQYGRGVLNLCFRVCN